MHGVEGPAAEEIDNVAGDDQAMPDAKEIRNAAGEQPRDSCLSTTTPVKARVTETKYQPESFLEDVRGLLSTGLLEGFRVTYKKNEVEMTGRINGQGYSCDCSECGYSNWQELRNQGSQRKIMVIIWPSSGLMKDGRMQREKGLVMNTVGEISFLLKHYKPFTLFGSNSAIS